MTEPKPFASLSSGLLARKGAAKPAMRPQGFGHLGGMEDLGWNDMGHGAAPAPGFAYPSLEEPREHVPSSIAALTPAPRVTDGSTSWDEEDSEAGGYEPPVIEQQRSIAASFATEPRIHVPAMPEPEEAEDEQEPPVALVAPRPAPSQAVARARRPRGAPGAKGKAAFTLRLDPERHLKLRLACAVRHRSAQQLVSEALDQFLSSLPELDALAQQLPAAAGKRN